MPPHGIASDSIVVLTTLERVELYRSVLGDDIDARHDARETTPLDAFMNMCASSGCGLFVIDEAHFVRPEDMLEGIEAYVDDTCPRKREPRLVIVCSERHAGDRMLARYATYCGIYDIVCGCDGAELSAEIANVAHRPRTRREAIAIIRGDPKLTLAAIAPTGPDKSPSPPPDEKDKGSSVALVTIEGDDAPPSEGRPATYAVDASEGANLNISIKIDWPR